MDRKGIKYLQDNGIKVQMFDRDLQDKIREANEAFIDQAMERAAASQEKKPEPIKLSPLEDPFLRAVTNDLSTEALEQYRIAAKIADPGETPGFQRRLSLPGLLKEEGGQ